MFDNLNINCGITFADTLDFYININFYYNYTFITPITLIARKDPVSLSCALCLYYDELLALMYWCTVDNG